MAHAVFSKAASVGEVIKFCLLELQVCFKRKDGGQPLSRRPLPATNKNQKSILAASWTSRELLACPFTWPKVLCIPVLRLPDGTLKIVLLVTL